MAITKNALIRYKVLDSCFRNSGKRYFIEDLIAECDKVLLEIQEESSGISKRQLFKDIRFMESKEGWNIDLERLKDGKRVYYRYADTSFSINNMPLNEVEIVQLQSAITILSQFEGMPQFEWVSELIPKIQKGLVARSVGNKIMSFDSNQYLKGIEFLGDLFNAIYYQKTLSVQYAPFECEEPLELFFHPYYLKQYNNRWFVLGYNPAVDRFDWNLALDRIISFKEVKESYRPNVTDWNNYYEDMIGVTKPVGAEPETVVLHFKGKMGNYVKTKPLHGSQKSKWLDDNTLEVSLSVIVNYELQGLILSYAESVSVIQPITLVESISKRLQLALSNYLS